MRFAAALLCASLVTISVAQQKSAKGFEGKPERGRYLAENVAMCIQCHTPREANGALIRSRAFSGAPVFVAKPRQLSSWAEFAPRIAGLPQYSEAQMHTLLTTGIGREGKPLRAPMPTFKMTREDAEDVIAFLKTLK
ncbi:MAG: c-type cytochrome [Ignavibacteriae bacterium]|nr:c-type cytochrome [Ignavibacteriota bacterium]